MGADEVLEHVYKDTSALLAEHGRSEEAGSSVAFPSVFKQWRELTAKDRWKRLLFTASIVSALLYYILIGFLFFLR